MEAPPGRALAAAGVVVSLAALAAAGWALHEASELRREGGRRAPDGSAAGDASPRTDALEERIRRLEEAVAAIPSGAGSSGGAAAPGSAADAASDPAAREPIRALIKDVIREEREAALKAAPAQRPASGADRKPPLSQFAAELDLQPGQRESVQRTVHQGQEGMIAVLRTATASGRVPLDELLDAMLGKPEEARTKLVEIYGVLATERVPGSDRTYAERVEALKGEAVESFRREFTAEQFKEFEKTGQDPLEIQIPDSPWNLVLQDALRRRK